MPVEVGKVVEGVVTGITNFGVFVQLEERKTGLVHISEVSDSYVKDIHDYLKEKDNVKVKVLSIDDKGKISLSIKQAKPKTKNPYQWTANTQSETRSMNFEEQLSNFLKDSEDRQQTLRKKLDSKRGGSYKRASVR